MFMTTLGVRAQLGSHISNVSFGSSWLLRISLLLKKTFTQGCVPTQLLSKLTNLTTAIQQLSIGKKAQG